MTTSKNQIILRRAQAFTLFELPNEILFFDYKDKITIQLEDIWEAFEMYAKYSKGYRYKALLSFGPYASITTEARKYSENKQMPTPAQAILIKNLSQRILAKFYMLLRKDKHPLRFFDNRDKAIEWLSKY